MFNFTFTAVFPNFFGWMVPFDFRKFYNFHIFCKFSYHLNCNLLARHHKQDSKEVPPSRDYSRALAREQIKYTNHLRGWKSLTSRLGEERGRPESNETSSVTGRSVQPKFPGWGQKFLGGKWIAMGSEGLVPFHSQKEFRAHLKWRTLDSCCSC